MADKPSDNDTGMPDAPSSSSSSSASSTRNPIVTPPYDMFPTTKSTSSTAKAWEPERPRDPHAQYSSEDERSSSDERDEEIRADRANRDMLHNNSAVDRSFSFNNWETLTNLAIILAAPKLKTFPSPYKIPGIDGVSMINESPAKIHSSAAEKQAEAIRDPKQKAFLESQFRARLRFLADIHNRRVDRENAKSLTKAKAKEKAAAATAASASQPRRVKPQPSAFTLNLPMRGPKKETKK